MGVWQNFTQLGKNFIDAGNIRCFASSTNMFIETLSYIKPHFEFSNAFDVFQKSLQDAYNSHQLNSKNSLCWEEALHLMSVALKGTQSKIIFKPDREVFKNVKKHTKNKLGQ